MRLVLIIFQVIVLRALWKASARIDELDDVRYKNQFQRNSNHSCK